METVKIRKTGTITFDKDGETAYTDWWEPEVGDILCALCGKCPGWRSTEKKIDCVTGNRWCG